MKRRVSRAVSAGGVVIGGGADISVQSMTNTPAGDITATVAQMKTLEAAGCDIIRAAVPDEAAAGIFSAARAAGVKAPLVADIHFDYRIALAAIRMGADKIRINPGNIGEGWKVREVAQAAAAAGVPIRIGVNGGSLEKKLLEKYGSPTPSALAESALTQAEQLEGYGFSDIVISIKSSRIETMLGACEEVAAQSDYPLHLGVTEAGDGYSGLVKNSVGIGSLLLRGIGDTIRVSLTASPESEVRAGREILRSLGLLRGGIDIISCPTCGRTKIDLISLAARFREAADTVDTHGVKVTCAIMGCAVNGPGEAREADFGIAGGDGCAVLFRHGETVGRISEDRIIPVLLEETDRIIKGGAKK